MDSMTIPTDRAGRAPSSRGAFALWALGFRPFYLLASVYAALSVPLWVAQYRGWIDAGGGMLVHAHEMLFGFTLAVIAGFLFTAVRNWTARPTPTGRALMAIAGLWLAARIAVWTPFPLVAAIANAAFPLAVAVGIGLPIFASGNRRNYFFVALLAGVALAALSFHLGSALAGASAAFGLRAMQDIVLFVLVVMGGRVIPMFTNNGVPGTDARRIAALEKLALASVLAVLALDLAGVEGTIAAVVLAVAGVAHLARVALWQTAKTLRVPLVWALHAGYLWIPVHLLLRAASTLSLSPAPLATHALTVGAIGGLVIAMITRTAKGHTGRPLIATRADTACYVLVLAAALLRVIGPLLVPDAYVGWVTLSAVAWSAAFGLYAITYWPVLSRARVDGKPG
jgi:uncharacterized protein involved in response to NO